MQSPIRFHLSVDHYRPVIASGTRGDFTLSGLGAVSGAVWRRRAKAVVDVQGEVFSVDAQGFFPSGTDLRIRDQLVAEGSRYEVVTVIDGKDFIGRADHVGVELRFRGV